MSDPNDPRQTSPQENWEPVSQAVQKLSELGWVAAANLVDQPGQQGFADIAFTPSGIAALKPFADFWRTTGGMDERTLLAVFWLADRSQK